MHDLWLYWASSVLFVLLCYLVGSNVVTVVAAVQAQAGSRRRVRPCKSTAQACWVYSLRAPGMQKGQHLQLPACLQCMHFMSKQGSCQASLC
jgi:hypothetical protein